MYPGGWLREPLVDDDAVRRVETGDSLSRRFLHVNAAFDGLEILLANDAHGSQGR
jgi:hypothetical protein